MLRLEPLLIGSIFPIHGEDRIVVTPAGGAAAAAGGAQGGRGPQVRHPPRRRSARPSLRAVWVNVRAGQIEQGGSTLTQQLVRSYFLDSRQTLVAQGARGGHGDGARCALQQGGSHERLHQRDLPRPGRRPRHPRLRAREPVLLRQAARGARPVGGGAAGGDRARALLLRPAPPPGPRARAARPGAEGTGASSGIVSAAEARLPRPPGRSGSPRAPPAPTTRRTSTSCAARCAATTATRT